MRKLFMTTAIVLPFTLAPAFAQDTTTEQPAMDPAADAQTDPAADAAAAEAEAAAAAEEALKAEVAESGKVAQQQAANELRLDWVTDATVTSMDGTSIGSINDLIVDGENGSMIAAIIGVGGFLGIGEKQIAVPWDQLTINADAQEITTDLTTEEADVAPAYVFRERAEAPGAAVEGEMAPADGAADPAAGDAMVPADDAAAPADDAMAPADDAAAPADDTMAPADDAAAPADDTMAPADDAAAPADDAMAPADDAAETDGEEPASN